MPCYENVHGRCPSGCFTIAIGFATLQLRGLVPSSVVLCYLNIGNLIHMKCWAAASRRSLHKRISPFAKFPAFGMSVKAFAQSLSLVVELELPNRYRDCQSANRYC